MRVQALDSAVSAAEPGPVMVWRIRTVAVCAALTALAFAQSPGLVVADSKIDLVINPDGFLARSLALWNPAPTFGELQNQAYGYLFPMGPFFAAGTAVGVPAWAVQRLWWALVMCVAFVGAARLAGRLSIGSPGARMVAGVAFALSPRILTQLGASSVEAWPTAVAPWVLVPLVGLAKGGSLRRAVALSALAVACAGGVNATAVLATVPLAVLWLASLRPLRRRLAALAGWSVAVACATAWWAVPLLVLGRFSPPFLDYIETAEVTTRYTDPVTLLRGAGYWLAYLHDGYGPTLPAGWAIATEPTAVVATMVIAGLGVLGLARRGMPHRRFLVTGLVVGVALVGLGHVSALPGTFAQAQRELLDGLGSPLRNVHKFDVAVRLPLTLGLAHVLGLASRARTLVRHGIRPLWAPATAVQATALIAVAVVAAPALSGGLAAPRGFVAVPGYWREAASWVDSHAGRDRVLVVPAAGFPAYQWGSTGDEIAQALLHGSWAVRNAIPLTAPTTIRLLDAVESVLATGSGSPGLADVLARSGVRYLLLRSDLDYGRSASTPPLVVRQALQRSAGLFVAASFGPLVGGTQDGGTQDGATLDSGTSVDRGLSTPVRALEVYAVDRSVSPVVAYDRSDVTTVVGGPESLLDLAAAGLLPPAPTVLAGDLTGQALPGPVALTDGLRRRDVAFGQLHDNTSATMTADEAFPSTAPAHDYLPSWAGSYLTTVAYQELTSLAASSSWSSAQALTGSRPEHQAYAAFDGDPTTSWRPAPGTPAPGQWIEVHLQDPRTIPEVQVRFDVAADSVPTRLRVSAGAESSTLETFGPVATVHLPGIHATRTLRLTVESVLGRAPGAQGFGISEITVAGLHPARTLVLPALPSAPELSSITMTAAPSVPACFFVDGGARCAQDVARGSEDGTVLDRSLVLPAASTYRPVLWARPRPGPDLDALLDREIAATNPLGLAPSVDASSTAVADPAGRPGAAIDGDPTTAWSPAPGDANPMLRLAWPGSRLVAGLRIVVDPSVAGTRPQTIRVVGDDGVRGGSLDRNGVIIFDPPVHTDDLSIFILDPPTAPSFNPRTNQTETVAVAVGEVTTLPDAVKPPVNLDRAVALACGSGPSIELGSTRIQTRLAASLRDLWQLRDILAEPCLTGTDVRVSLPQGQLRVIATGSALATPVRLALRPDAAPAPPPQTPVRIDSWSANERRVHVDPHPADRILAVRENTNPGWQASLAGHLLAPIVVDGWQQGWLLPAGLSGEVTLRFGPDAPYRAGLLGGAGLLLLVLVVASLPARRRGSHDAAGRPGRGYGRLAAVVVGGGALILAGGAVGLCVTFAGAVAAAYLSLPGRPAPDARRRHWLRVGRSWLPVVLVVLADALSLTVADSHTNAGPQVLGLLAVASLWLSVVLSPAARPARAQPHERALEQVVARGGEDQPARGGERVGAQKVSREHRPAGD